MVHTLGNNILGEWDFKIQNELLVMIFWQEYEICRYKKLALYNYFIFDPGEVSYFL